MLAALIDMHERWHTFKNSRPDAFWFHEVLEAAGFFAMYMAYMGLLMSAVLGFLWFFPWLFGLPGTFRVL